MVYFKQISYLHENLPYFLLKLWESSPIIIDITRRLAFGSYDYKKWLKFLKKMERAPLEKIREFQYLRLKKILKHAYENVPFYRELWDKHNVKPSDIKNLKDLEKLPIITKDDVVENYKKFFAKNSKYKNNMFTETSGTSGRAVRFYHDEEGVGANWAGDRYFKEIIGYKMGDDLVLNIPLVNEQIYLLPDSHKMKRHHYPVTKQISFRPSVMDDNIFEEYLKYIRKFNIKNIDGFSSFIFLFSKYLKKKNEKIDIKTITSHSEVLYDFQRKYIEDLFSIKIFNKYASSECTVRAFECHEHNGMHISPQGIAEIKGKGLDGKGELVMTSLVNRLFPLIRYSTKDIVELSQKECSCGRTYPRIMKIEGRANDFVILPNKKKIAPSILFFMTVYIKGIKDIHFLQNKNYNLEVSIVKEKDASKEEILREVRKSLNSHLKRRIKFKIIFRDKIDRKGRKFTFVESKVKSN